MVLPVHSWLHFYIFVLLLMILCFSLFDTNSYYDTFLSRYQELAMERNWKQPLKSVSLCLLLSRITYHFAISSLFTVNEFSFSIATFSLWIAVALCYSVQIVDEGTIPLTPNDILVDALVSPSGVIPISPAALEIHHWKDALLNTKASGESPVTASSKRWGRNHTLLNSDPTTTNPV